MAMKFNRKYEVCVLAFGEWTSLLVLAVHAQSGIFDQLLLRVLLCSIVLYCRARHTARCSVIVGRCRIFTTAIKRFVVVIVVTAQCTLVHMRGLGIACRPSVCPSVRL